MNAKKFKNFSVLKNGNISNIQKELKKKGYGFYGNSAVEVCLWTKNALRGKGVCYKEKFYGIKSHRCMQFSPVLECEERCIFCWRPVEIFKKGKIKAENPENMIENLIKERKILLSGFGSSVKDKKLLEESKIPTLFSFSLIGEPTLYPYLPEAIEFIKKKNKDSIIFLVTNGQEPKMIEKLVKQNALPTQMTLSVVAGNKKLFEKICKPFYKDAWKRFNKTISLFKKLKCRKVLRFVIIKGLNDSEKQIKEFSGLIEKAKPDFVHVKGYTHLGNSRRFLKAENQPFHKEIKEISKRIIKLAKEYNIAGDSEISRVVLLKNKKSKYPLKIN